MSYELFTIGRFPNLAINQDKGKDFLYVPGQTGSPIPTQYKPTVKKVDKIRRGSNVEYKQKKRKKDRKKKSQEYKVAKQRDFQFTNDVVNFTEPKGPTTKA